MKQLTAFDLGPAQSGSRSTTPIIKRCVSMSRVEIFVPAELAEIPADLAEAFNHKFMALECDHCETVSIYGLDLSRGLKSCEEEALNDVWFHFGVYSRIFTR